jgi:lipopolysaccharide export system ATP-binding protein
MKEMILHLKNKGISILITDHNAQEIFSIADISFIVMEGKILKSGTAEALVLDPTVRSRYLGQRFSLQPEKSS